MQQLINRKNLLLSKYENITKQDIDDIDKIINHEIKEKKIYINKKDNNLLKIINYFSKNENVDLRNYFQHIIYNESELLFNPNMPISLIEKLNIDIYDWIEWVSRNPNLNINYILDNRLKKYNNWNWNWLTINPSITIKDMVNHNNNDTFWNFNDFIIENDNITFQHLLYYHWNIDWFLLSAHKNFTLLLINKFIDKIIFDQVCKNPNIDIEFILCHQDKNLNWQYLSQNPGINLDNIEQNINLPWDWEFISLNPNITINFILKYVEKNWDWHYLTYNPNITMDIIEQNINLPWDWNILAINPNINLEFILNHMDKVNKNSNLSFKRKIKFHNENNMNLLDITKIYLNEFLYNNYVYKKNIIKDIENRKLIIYNILNKYINNDLNRLICEYIYYN